MPKQPEIVEGFGRLADDFLLNIVLSKIKFQNNGALPFVHAHVLELSAKAAYYSVDPDALGKKTNHNIRAIYDALTEKIAGFSDLLPSEEAYKRYEEVWLKGDGPHEISFIPPPEELFEWEVCFFIDNIVDLKYGYNKKNELVSALQIETPNLNPRFKSLFKACRIQYATEQMNRSSIEKGISIFGKTDANIETLNDLFGELKNG